MNILWHMPTLRERTCGLSIRALRMAAELRDRGHTITFAVAGDKTDIPGEQLDGFAIRKIAATRARRWHWSVQALAKSAEARRLARSLDGRHDLFISCQPEIVEAYRRLHVDAPVVFVCGGSTLLHDPADRRRQASLPRVRRLPYLLDRALKRRNEANAFRVADANVFDSHRTRAMVTSAYRLDASTCRTVHGGVDADRFTPVDEADRQAIRAKLGIRDDGLVLAWTGRLSPEKNVQLLIRAVPRCRCRVRRVFIVGDGPTRGELEAICRQAHLDPIVTFAGEQSDVRPYLHAADVFVFPSRSESFGGSLIEAMACGLPCIALRPDGADIENASEEILGNGGGVLVDADADDPTALAEAIDALVQDPASRRQLGRRARRLAMSKFTWAAAGRELNAPLTEMVGRTKRESSAEVPETQSMRRCLTRRSE